MLILMVVKLPSYPNLCHGAGRVAGYQASKPLRPMGDGVAHVCMDRAAI